MDSKTLAEAPVNDGERSQATEIAKVSASQYDAEMGNEAESLAEVERVYRRLDRRIIPGNVISSTGASLEKLMRIVVRSFVDSLLPVLCHSIECWPGADDEQGSRSRPLPRTTFESPSGVHRTRSVLRMLRPI